MFDFERFLSDNGLKKKDIAEYLQVSKAFVTQLCQGLRKLPPEKFALLKANAQWDCSALGEGDMLRSEPRNVNSQTVRIGNITASSSGSDSSELAALRAENESLRAQVDRLTKIIENLTSK